MVSSCRAARAGNKSSALQLKEDLHQESRRDIVPLGNFPYPNRLASSIAGGELKHRDTGVFGLG
jgi:hypothetical protein